MRDAVRGAAPRLGWTPAEAVQRSNAPAVSASLRVAPRKTEGCVTRLALVPTGVCASRLPSVFLGATRSTKYRSTDPGNPLDHHAGFGRPREQAAVVAYPRDPRQVLAAVKQGKRVALPGRNGMLLK